MLELADWIDQRLRARGDPARAVREKAYLKSTIEHYGVAVPAMRAIAKSVAKAHPTLDHDELAGLATELWRTDVYEHKAVTVELLVLHRGLLVAADIELLEDLLRRSGTWALVDHLAEKVVGDLVTRYRELDGRLDRWASDDDFWIRRSALLALLAPLRAGGGDFAQFGRYADAMLDEKEFFVRKAIGWVLRETGKKRPDVVFDWLLPRAARASGVTTTEAVKPLSAEQRELIRAAR